MRNSARITCISTDLASRKNRRTAHSSGTEGQKDVEAVLWGIPKRSAGEEQHGMETGEGAISFQYHQALEEAWKREEISKQE